jgi:hypothetical protein
MLIEAGADRERVNMPIFCVSESDTVYSLIKMTKFQKQWKALAELSKGEFERISLTGVDLSAHEDISERLVSLGQLFALGSGVRWSLPLVNQLQSHM